MSDTAITVRDLYKTFDPQFNSKRLKVILAEMLKGKAQKTGGHTVLKGIDLEVKKGEFLGVVGRNGSGKSTLLKILAGVYSPSSGAVSVEGTLTPFIELGVGFNPELSGKDNVFLNGALLGFDRNEMSEMYDDIVSFAELSEFMEEKLKNFSSGMQVRLAFSIAIKAKSEVLLIDEVLAVGDANFQKKCFDVFQTFKDSGQTVVFVTHSMEQVGRFCDRAVVIEEGKITFDGDPQVAAKRYDDMNKAPEPKNPTKKQKKEKKAEFTYRRGNNKAVVKGLKLDKKSYSVHSPMEIDVTYSVEDAGVKSLHYGLSIYRSDRVQSIYAVAGTVDKDKTLLSFKIDQLHLTPGKYFISIGLTHEEDAWSAPYDLIEKGFEFTVSKDSKKQYGLAPLHMETEVNNAS